MQIILTQIQLAAIVAIAMSEQSGVTPLVVSDVLQPERFLLFDSARSVYWQGSDNRITYLGYIRFDGDDSFFNDTRNTSQEYKLSAE